MSAIPSPSPRSLFSGMFEGDAESDKNTSGFTFPGPENSDGATKAGAVGEQKASSRSGLVERMAARAGYNAPLRLNTDLVRPSSSSSADISQTCPPYLLSPGLSPTSFLESPVFLSNSLVQPSPTTGKFPFAQNGDGDRSSMMFSDSSNKNKDNLFAFKPVPESVSKVNPGLMSWQSFPSIEASNGTSLHLHTNLSTEKKAQVNNSTSQGFGGVNGSVQESRSIEEHHDDNGNNNNNNNSGPSEDGYNWRKYGQKQVKGSEYPRSYYKCTYSNCPVKKKVERSHEGHITEIIYKGAHNHPKPPPSRRSGISDIQGDHVWDGTTSSTMLLNGTQFESSDAVDGSSTFSNDDEEEEEEEEEDRATHGSVSLGYDIDGEGDESESKRRKVEAYAADVSGASRAMREPRVVVQTTSEVDILDDGYRWRKYGQKVVKGNPNPRSYYKCTSTGCTVRKHVERASHDLKSVITTYEGKHNHDVPAARNSSHVNSQAQPQAHRPDQSSSMARFDYSLQQGGPPSHAYGYGYGTGLGQMAMPGFGGSQGKFPVHQFVGQMMLPKGEPKVEPVSDASSLYHNQMMNRLPLGPHM
ncbi:hypothetical protein L1887_42432 [Cichorium endivia]|nr:hypothetical protein L1887_42432 [Cichorium endivia]